MGAACTVYDSAAKHTITSCFSWTWRKYQLLQLILVNRNANPVLEGQQVITPTLSLTPVGQTADETASCGELSLSCTSSNSPEVLHLSSCLPQWNRWNATGLVLLWTKTLVCIHKPGSGLLTGSPGTRTLVTCKMGVPGLHQTLNESCEEDEEFPFVSDKGIYFYSFRKRFSTCKILKF